MQEAVAWNKNQKARVQSYKPQNPELPSDFACPPGQCTIPPPSSPIEGFDLQLSNQWIYTIISASLLFMILTRAF